MLNNLSFSLAAGESVSLLGANGSGKTTLLRVIAGLLDGATGSILVGGAPVRAGHAGIGIAFQEPRLLEWRSALRNVALPLELRRVAVGVARERAAGALKRVGAEQLADRRVDQLSGGERQRVALARALVQAPGLLLLDEPFAALDPRTRARLDDELPEAIGMASSLLVTHDIAEALVVSDRVLVLGASGAITAEVEGLRRRTPSERRRALMSDDGLARQSRLFGALEEVGDA